MSYLNSFLLTFAVTMALCGCAGSPRSNNIEVLPDLKVYSRPVQKSAATEMQTNACPVLNTFMVDYKVMRDETRAAQKVLRK